MSETTKTPDDETLRLREALDAAEKRASAAESAREAMRAAVCELAEHLTVAQYNRLCVLTGKHLLAAFRVGAGYEVVSKPCAAITVEQKRMSPEELAALDGGPGIAAALRGGR